MKQFIWVCATLMAMFATGDSLICNTCKFGFGKCLWMSTETCSNNETRCHVGKLTFNISRMMSYETRGCLQPSLCNQTETGTLLTAGYTVTRTCCMADCCNGATALQLPLAAALGSALMVFWSTYTL